MKTNRIVMRRFIQGVLVLGGLFGSQKFALADGTDTIHYRFHNTTSTNTISAFLTITPNNNSPMTVSASVPPKQYVSGKLPVPAETFYVFGAKGFIGVGTGITCLLNFNIYTSTNTGVFVNVGYSASTKDGPPTKCTITAQSIPK